LAATGVGVFAARGVAAAVEDAVRDDCGDAAALMVAGGWDPAEMVAGGSVPEESALVGCAAAAAGETFTELAELGGWVGVEAGVRVATGAGD